jgi:hypothetical protein
LTEAIVARYILIIVGKKNKKMEVKKNKTKEMSE